MKILAILTGLAVGITATQADVLVSYLETGGAIGANPRDIVPAASSAPGLAASDMDIENYLADRDLVRTSFGDVSFPAGTGYWTTLKANDDFASDPGTTPDFSEGYFKFTLTANAGNMIDATSLAFDWGNGSNNGALTQETFGYRAYASVDGGAFTSVGSDSVTMNLADNTFIQNTSANIDLSGLATTADGGSIEIRILQFTSNGNTGTISDFQNIKLNGDIPTFTDTDGDGMGDNWENNNGLVVGVNDSALDEDSNGGPDGLTNLQEYNLGTDPQDSDTDDDGLLDGVETGTGIYVSPSDTGTDPLIEDTDGDYYPDGEEVANGSDPTDSDSIPPPPPGMVEVAPDGAWTWFNDERAIFHNGFLYSGYVRTDGYQGITRYDPATGAAIHMQLGTAASRQTDDHNNPSLTVLPDGRLLAVYSKHNDTSGFRYRTSKVAAPSTDADWNAEQIKSTVKNSYSNTYRLTAESNKIYNFHRSINWNPTLTRSVDNGSTWDTPTQFISKDDGERPYVRYCSNHGNRIDLIYTDGHPRDINNSIYHLYYQGGNFNQTDGTLVKTLANLPINHDTGERGAVVYPYSSAAWGAGEGPDDWIPSGRAWTWDIHYGSDGHPVCTFQVQRDDVTGSGWNHDRIYYYYARWTGTEWQRRFIAHAGRGLYDHEDDYGGGMAIDPDDPQVIYISSNAADPFNISDIDNVPLGPNERYEIWRGFTADGGLTFTWQSVTTGSNADNLRPIVPENHGRTRHVLWFNGTYSSYTSFSTKVLGVFDDPKEEFTAWQTGFDIGGAALDDDSDGDGLVDLLEYALGGSPTDPEDTPFPTISSDRFSFHHLPPRTDVEWIVEATPDLLGTWTEIAIVRAAGLPNDIADGYTLGTDSGDPALLTIDPDAESPQGFYRLKVRYGN